MYLPTGVRRDSVDVSCRHDDAVRTASIVGVGLGI
jgi:hypothetical protein